MNAANKLDSEEKKPLQPQTPSPVVWYGKNPDESTGSIECNELLNHTTNEDEDRRVLVQIKREGTVKDLTQKLAAQNLIPSSPVEDKVSRYFYLLINLLVPFITTMPLFTFRILIHNSFRF